MVDGWGSVLGSFKGIEGDGNGLLMDGIYKVMLSLIGCLWWGRGGRVRGGIRRGERRGIFSEIIFWFRIRKFV